MGEFLILLVGLGCLLLLLGFALLIFNSDPFDDKNKIISLIATLFGIFFICYPLYIAATYDGDCGEKIQLEKALEDCDVYFNGEEISGDAFTSDMILKNHYSYNISDDSLYIFSR